MQSTMLNLVNQFLMEKGRATVGPTDGLYSAGLLDSMEMLELMLYLNNHDTRIDVSLNGTNYNLEEMDSVEKLEKLKHKA